MNTTAKAALLLSLPVLLGSVASAAADEVRMLDNMPSVEELRGYLVPEAPRRTRSIEIVGSMVRPPSGQASGYAKAAATSAMPSNAYPAQQAAAPTAPVVEEVAPEEEPEATPAAAPTTIGYRIQFAFDSAEILPVSQPFLDQLGKLLSEEGELALVVEGHTDARGGEDYNLALSKRRAEAVKAYLAHTWEVSADRLVVEGKGESNPMTANGEAPENRRVQFRRIGA